MATTYTGSLIKDTSIGTCFWSEMSSIAKDQLLPGVTNIMKLLDKNSRSSANQLFFAEYFLNTLGEIDG